MLVAYRRHLMVCWRCPHRSQEAFALDLHGFSAETAACAVRYVLANELGNYIQQDLKIITGRGKHSIGEPVLFNR